MSPSKKPTPAFCSTCGRPLCLRWIDEFDAQTGRRATRHVLSCVKLTNPQERGLHFCASYDQMTAQQYAVPTGLERNLHISRCV
jgi:hypothetical protein